MDDKEYLELKRQEDRALADDDFVVGDDDENGSEAGSEADSVAASEDSRNVLDGIVDLSDLEDSEDAKEDPHGDGGKRKNDEIHRRQVVAARAKRKQRNKFFEFNMPKISDLRKASGRIPRTPPEKKKRKKDKNQNDDDGGEKVNVVGELIDSAKEVLAYFAGEESYEHRRLSIWDTPEILENIYYTQRRRLLITWMPGRYKLNTSGFRRYYKPASDVLLVACRAKVVKPFYVADLLEEGADPNIIEEGTNNRPLHYLCRRGNYQGVRFLIEAGADVNPRNAARRTPLMSACDTQRTGPQLRIVRHLLKQPGVLQTIEWRDNGGNTAAMNAVFKNNVWILRTLLLAGARVTEEDPYWGYESTHHVACWVYAAGLLSDIDQLPAMALQEDHSKMGLLWRYTSPKGHYRFAPILLAQSTYKYNAELCFRMCQHKKRTEDKVVYPPRPKREVIKMAEKKRDDRRQRRLDREEAKRRKEIHNSKLVNRKLGNEVKEIEDWNMRRLLMAKSIDTAYEKGLRGQKDQSTYEWVLKQHRDRKTGEVDEQHWEMQGKKGSFYISPAPKLPKTKYSEVELGRVLEERHNRTHAPKDRIHIFSGGTPEDAYARASWVEKDKAAMDRLAQASGLLGKGAAKVSSRSPAAPSKGTVPLTVGEGSDKDGYSQGQGEEETKETKESNPAIVDARGSPAKANGWKLAKRVPGLGFVDDSTQWARNKVTRPFIVPFTEDEVNFSSEEEDEENGGENRKFFAME